MSSEQQPYHNLITLENYEEFFLLYTDGELSPSDKNRVEEFVKEHPQLQEELNQFLQTRLPLESIQMDKQGLSASDMMASMMEEDLLLYIDHEISDVRKAEMDQHLAKNPMLAHQLEILQRVKLDSSDQIEYPWKETLYRRTERRLPVAWMRVAAAVILLAVTGLVYKISFRTKELQDNGTGLSAITRPAPHPTIHQQITVSPVQEVGTSNLQGSTRNSIVQSPIKKSTGRDQYIAAKHQPVPEHSIQPDPEPQTLITRNNMVASLQHEDAPINKIEALQANINEKPVTSALAVSYNNQEAQQEDHNAVAESHKGSFRGFLRKATRMIEKRTGIDPSNDNDEILIGAVAIKLK